MVLTGAETDAQAGGWTSLGGGLLTSDTSALVTITGGAGNSFYDLSSLTLAAARHYKASFDGGHGTGANSEIAFNNYFVANASPRNLNGTVVNISNIQVLDDTGDLVSRSTRTGDRTSQGGVINMADFNLAPLNTNYDLLSGPLGNLFYVKGGSVLQDPTFAAGNDVAPAGFQLLQLLDADGSTANPGSNLTSRRLHPVRRQYAGRSRRDRHDADVQRLHRLRLLRVWRHHSNTVAWTGYNITIDGSENPGPSNETLVNYKAPWTCGFRTMAFTCKQCPPEQRPCRFTRWNG